MKGFDGFFENASIETKRFLCRVNDIFGKQKELEQQSRKLATQATRYVAQTQQWLALVDNFNNSLKELGDVKHWAQMMEHDMRTIMSTLEFVHQGDSK
ncbi:hypothetical protein G6F62_009980 [Rhizopus arrhizus]|nr:hypothetical protein G6F62_009980 [Rhizopus arrhizus]